MVGIIGSGSWATAIVKVLLDGAEACVNWWVRNEAVRQSLQAEGRNAKHLPEVQFDRAKLRVDGSLARVVAASTDLVLAIPSAFIAEVLQQLPAEAYAGKNIISAIKGAVPGAGLPVSMYLKERFGVPDERICIISGPTHAEEVVLGRPTFIAVASGNERLAERVEQMMQCGYMHTRRTTDIGGVERTGLVKNVYAIAAGLCQGLGYGDNLKAVVTTAAYRELRTMLAHCFPWERRQCDEYCYLGDLMVTCWSVHSRNRGLGEAVAKGETVEEVFARMGTVPEGYTSVQIIHERAVDHGVQAMVPIIEGVYRVLYEGASPASVVEKWIKEAL